SSAAQVPSAADCMSTALYEDFKSAYCPSEQPNGYLALDTFKKVELSSPASHMSIPGQMAAFNPTPEGKNLRFQGSRVEEFMTGAFNGTLIPSCTAKVVNP
ncbi:MAG: hypothetical protein ACRCSF_09215, partial [Mycobacteriaceae bacterium]